MRLPIIAALVAAFVLTACGGSRSPTGNDVQVTGVGPADIVVGGSTATFTMTVTNVGGNTATDVKLVNSVGNQLALTEITCVAAGGAVCPDAPSVVMTIGSMPEGSSLVVTVKATVATSANGTITNTMVATVSDDTNRLNNSATAQGTAQSLTSFGVVQTAPATVAAGSTTAFTAVVSNPGSAAATNITITETLSRGYAVTVSCTASSGATCPTTLGPTMTLASLPAGRFLTITYLITVPSADRGDIVNVVTVTSDNDTQTDNNTSSATIIAGDSMSGAYTVYAANGQQYDLTIDFDALSYTMSSANLPPVSRSFTADASAGGYTVSGNSRFRTADNLIVGGHDFGTGVLPYVAARTFVTAGAGTYNLATRNVSTTGATSHAGTARISGNVLQVCQVDAAVITTQECGSAMKNYTLTVSGNEFTGSETSSGEVFTFRLARVGNATILLSARPATDGSQQFRIGLPDSAGLLGGTLSGSSTNGDWISVTMTPSSYAYLGGSLSESLQLQVTTTVGPFAMIPDIQPGFPYGSAHYVLQASPLAVMVGDFGGTANGLLQVSLP